VGISSINSSINDNGWLIGWEINVPFQHKNRLYPGQGLGWRFSSVKLRMANDTVTFRPRCLFLKRRLTSSAFDSTLCTSITPSLFHSQLKTYLFHKSYPPLVSLLPPGLPPWTFAWTVSSELFGFLFYFFLIFCLWTVR